MKKITLILLFALLTQTITAQTQSCFEGVLEAAKTDFYNKNYFLALQKLNAIENACVNLETISKSQKVVLQQWRDSIAIAIENMVSEVKAEKERSDSLLKLVNIYFLKEENLLQMTFIDKKKNICDKFLKGYYKETIELLKLLNFNNFNEQEFKDTLMQKAIKLLEIRNIASDTLELGYSITAENYLNQIIISNPTDTFTFIKLYIIENENISLINDLELVYEHNHWKKYIFHLSAFNKLIKTKELDLSSIDKKATKYFNKIFNIRVLNKIFNILKYFDNLEYLKLSNNNLKSIPKSISKLKHLKYLDLSKNNFSEEEKSKIESWFEGTDCKIYW